MIVINAAIAGIIGYLLAKWIKNGKALFFASFLGSFISLFFKILLTPVIASALDREPDFYRAVATFSFDLIMVPIAAFQFRKIRRKKAAKRPSQSS